MIPDYFLDEDLDTQAMKMEAQGKKCIKHVEFTQLNIISKDEIEKLRLLHLFSRIWSRFKLLSKSLFLSRYVLFLKALGEASPY